MTGADADGQGAWSDAGRKVNARLG